MEVFYIYTEGNNKKISAVYIYNFVWVGAYIKNMLYIFMRIICWKSIKFIQISKY